MHAIPRVVEDPESSGCPYRVISTEARAPHGPGLCRTLFGQRFARQQLDSINVGLRVRRPDTRSGGLAVWRSERRWPRVGSSITGSGGAEPAAQPRIGSSVVPVLLAGHHRLHAGGLLRLAGISRQSCVPSRDKKKNSNSGCLGASARRPVAPFATWTGLR